MGMFRYREENWVGKGEARRGEKQNSVGGKKKGGGWMVKLKIKKADSSRRCGEKIGNGKGSDPRGDGVQQKNKGR